MRIIEPSYEILTEISYGGIKELQHIEKIGRVCYKSEDKITEDGESAKKFVKMLIGRGHKAMIEHSSTKTEITITANYREWRNFFKLRTAKVAHPQMQEVTRPLLKELKTILPVIFDDIEVED